MNRPRGSLDRWLRWLLIAALVASLLSVVPSLVFSAKNTVLLTGIHDRHFGIIIFPLFTLPFLAVGAVVAWRRPRNAVAWCLLGVGAAFNVGVAASAYAGWAFLSDAVTPVTQTLTVVARVLFIVPIVLVPLVVVRLPSGETVTRHGRRLSRASAVLGFVLMGWWALGSDAIAIPSGSDLPDLRKLTNPFDLFGLDPDTASTVSALLVAPILVCWLLASIGLVRRVRRGSAETRAQGRWILLGVLTLPIGYLTAGIVDAAIAGDTDWPWITAFALGVLAAPVAIGVAVSRYRLYEIDRIISRTVSYFLVVALLASVYALVALGPTFVLGSADSPSWLVALATLSAVALFNPLRGRVQAGVDRRFNRSRYDAEQVIEGFGHRVPDGADVGVISAEWADAVTEILQPGSVGIWVR